MKTRKRVGVGEFGRRVSAIVRAAEPVVVEKQGVPVGFYVPLTAKDKTKPQVKVSVEQLDAVVADILRRTGMTEAELVEEMTGNCEESVYGAPRY